MIFDSNLAREGRGKQRATERREFLEQTHQGRFGGMLDICNITEYNSILFDDSRFIGGEGEGSSMNASIAIR